MNLFKILILFEADLSSFIQTHFSSDDSPFPFLLGLIHARLNFFLKSKSFAFEFLSKMPFNDQFYSEIILFKLNLLFASFDEQLFSDLLCEISSSLSNENFFKIPYQRETLIEVLNQFSDLKVPNYKSIQSIIDDLNKRNQKLSNFDDGLSFESDFLPTLSIPSRDLDDILLNEVNEDFKYRDILDFFDDFINKKIEIPVKFECLSCGILYKKGIPQLLVPFNFSELFKNKNSLPDNGLILFTSEIYCPICSSFKFLLNSNSRLMILYLTSHILKNYTKDVNYDVSDFSNSIVIGNFLSKYAKNARDMFEGLDIINNLIKDNPENESYLVTKGNMILWVKDYSEGLKIFKLILERNPQNFDALFNLCKIYFGRKNYKHCEKIVNQVISYISNDPSLIRVNLEYLNYIYDMVIHMRNSQLRGRYKKVLESQLVLV
jgi:tetratricopeptide (TPR) repeat protein